MAKIAADRQAAAAAGPPFEEPSYSGEAAALLIFRAMRDAALASRQEDEEDAKGERAAHLIRIRAVCMDV